MTRMLKDLHNNCTLSPDNTTALQQRNGIMANYSQNIIIAMSMQAQLKKSRLSASSDHV